MNIDKNFKKSSFSGTGTCVEVFRTSEKILVRDSKVSDGPTLSFTKDEWTAFMLGVKAGEFEVSE